MRVSDVMTHTPLTCLTSDCMSLAAHLMWKGDCGSVVVVDGEKPVGIITDRDICMAAFTQGLPLHDLRVAIGASRLVHTVEANDSLERAEATMRQWQLRRLPVVDASGALVGILSLNDLVRHATKVGAATNANGLTDPGIAQTVAAVCEPRKQAPRNPLALGCL